jgi:hypothetical protein
MRSILLLALFTLFAAVTARRINPMCAQLWCPPVSCPEGYKATGTVNFVNCPMCPACIKIAGAPDVVPTGECTIKACSRIACPMGYKKAGAVESNGCVRCPVCIKREAEVESDSWSCPAYSCPKMICYGRLESRTDVAGCPACPRCIHEKLKCERKSCPKLACGYSVPTFDKNGCPGCRHCIVRAQTE